MMILVNVFAVSSAALFFFKKISPFAFLISSALWFIMMILFWFLLPTIIYKNAKTFKDRLRVILGDTNLTLENEKGSRNWNWSDFSIWMESPHFFHLYFSNRSFFIIPKEAFEGDSEHDARKILAEKIKK